MTKVLLVSPNQERRPYPVPPFGLCLLAERLAPRHEVKVFDGMFEDRSGLEAAIHAFDPDVVGLGIRNVEDPVMERHRGFVDDIEERFVAPIKARTKAPLVLGGSGFSLFPRPMMERFQADFGIVGEAEHSLPKLVADLEDGRRPADDRGLVRAEEIGTDAPLEPGASRIDRWIDFTPYKARSTYPIQTKRGCQRHCVYCTYPRIEGRRLRLRAADAVADEIAEAVDRLGQDLTFEIVDSVFNDPPGHAEAICRALIERNLRIKLRTMGINPHTLTADLLASMRRAGFVQIHCSPDSASPSVLASMGKGFTREALETAANHIRDAEMPTMWFMLFGGPGETEETIRETVDFIDRFVDPRDMVDLWVGLRVYPGTRLHEAQHRNAGVNHDDDLLDPRYYVSPALGRARCRELVEALCTKRPNCVPAWESAPDPRMLREALTLRRELRIHEPMFRTFIRLRRERMGVRAQP